MSKPTQSQSPVSHPQKQQIDQSQRHFDIGLSLYLNEHPVEAIVEFNKSIDLCDSVETCSFLAACYASVGDFAQALLACDYAIMIEPSCAQAHYDRGVYLGKMRLFPEAIESLEAALALPMLYNRPQVHYTIGKLYEETGRYYDARESYKKSWKLCPSFVEGLEAYNMVIATLN